MRLRAILQVLLGLAAFILILASLQYFFFPQFTFVNDETTLTVTYSHLLKNKCVDIVWQTSGIQAIYIDGEGTVGEGQRTVCDIPYGPVITIITRSGIQLEYSRQILWEMIETLVWIATICVAISWLWPYRRSFPFAAALALLALLIWIYVGRPILPLTTWFASVSLATPLIRVLILALVIPLFYWCFVPIISASSFLLGVGAFTFAWYGANPAYLILLGVMIIWIRSLWLPPATQPIQPAFSILVGLLGILFTLIVLIYTTSSFDTQPAFNNLLPVFYGLLCLCIVLLVVVWLYYPYPSLWTFVKWAGSLCLVFRFLIMPALPDALIALSQPPLAVLCITAIALAGLAYRVGPALSEGQRVWWINGLLALVLCLFIVLKWPQGSIGGWLGFSYIAFRLMHVLLEYRKKTFVPTADVIQFGLYSTFFSSQSVGPIDLLPRFAPQIQEAPVFLWNDFGEGWRRILWGMIKKFYIADVILSRIIPGTVYLGILPEALAWIQLYAYAFYLYCDFSGFIDVAIGLGRLVGYQLPENFKSPYTAGNIAQFWQSWHITLSSWLRTYVFFPASRSLLRTSLKKSPLVVVVIANFTTMILIGLWHGLTLNFFLWGVWHAIGLSIHKVFSDGTRRIQINWRHTWRAQAFHILSMFLTFHFVLIGWVFFALPKFDDSLVFLKKLVGLS